MIQGIGLTYVYQNMYVESSMVYYATSVLTLVCGSTFVMWLAEQITAKGIGNRSLMVILHLVPVCLWAVQVCII